MPIMRRGRGGDPAARRELADAVARGGWPGVLVAVGDAVAVAMAAALHLREILEPEAPQGLLRQPGSSLVVWLVLLHVMPPARDSSDCRSDSSGECCGRTRA